MCDQLNFKQEYLRLRREMGQLLENGRINEGLSPKVIAKQNGFSSENDIYKIEQGHEKRLRRYFQLAEYYGLSFHMSCSFIDENYVKEYFKNEADDAKNYFFCVLSGILQRYRHFNIYSYKELSKLTDIPAQRIIDIEKQKTECSIDEACSLLTCFGKALIPEVCRKDLL